MNNPVDDALSAKAKLAAERKSEDLRLWQVWKADPTPKKLAPLISRFDPIIGQHVRKFKAPNVNEAALRANLQENTIKAFKNYNPDRAALNTHVTNYLRKGLRFTFRQQNLARIPEQKAEKIGPVMGAFDELRDSFGRAPTSMEIANHLNENNAFSKPISALHVSQIQKAQAMGDVSSGRFESEPNPITASREAEVLSLLRPSLKPDEQGVFDYLYGYSGKPRITSTGQIARKLGKSPSHVSRLKARISSQYERYK